MSERFVDRRVAYLSRRLKEGNRLLASVKDQGVVFVEGQEVGALRGFVFYPNLDDGENKTAILAAARRALPEEIQRRVGAFVASANLAFKLNSEGIIRWREAEVAHLKRVTVCILRAWSSESDLLSPEQGKQLSERLVLFVEEHLKGVLGGLLALDHHTVIIIF